nr:hypothetical protein [Mycobacterium lepraemurium]
MHAPSPDAIRAETIIITGHGGDEIEAYRAEAAVDGWRRIDDFFATRLKG